MAWEVLTRNPDLDATVIELHVEHGQVTLAGELAAGMPRWVADDLVNSVSGVRKVTNRLKVAR